MKFCKKCQIETERYSNGNCKPCCSKYAKLNRDRIKEYRKNNKEKVAKWNRTDYEKNKEKKIAYIAEWKRNNKEKVRASYLKNKGKYSEQQKLYRESKSEEIKKWQKEWREKNKEQLSIKRRENYKRNSEKEKEQMRAYRKANPEKIKRIRETSGRIWRENNREYMRAVCRNRRAKKKLIGGRHTAEDIINLFHLQKEKCACCKKSIKDGYHVDHIMPIAQGGSNDKYNLQLLCPTCNLQKSAKHPIEFMQSRGYLL